MRLILAGLAVATLSAQGITPDQLRPSPDAPTALQAVTATGFVPVRVGAGVSVQKDASGYVISATAAPTVIQVQTFILSATNGAYVTTAQIILRNNVPQVEGIDYKRDATGIVPLQPWSAIDVIVGLRISLQPG